MSRKTKYKVYKTFVKQRITMTILEKFNLCIFELKILRSSKTTKRKTDECIKVNELILTFTEYESMTNVNDTLLVNMDCIDCFSKISKDVYFPKQPIILNEKISAKCLTYKKHKNWFT